MAISVTKRPQKFDAKKLRAYQTYYFTYKDPVIEAVRQIIVSSQLTWTQISLRSNISYATLHNWFEGETRRPQFASIMAVIHACDKDITDLRITEDRRPTKLRLVRK